MPITCFRINVRQVIKPRVLSASRTSGTFYYSIAGIVRSSHALICRIFAEIEGSLHLQRAFFYRTVDWKDTARPRMRMDSQSG